MALSPATAPNAFKGSLGGGYGASNVKDTYSGKPLLTFEDQTHQSSDLLKNRVAPTFDPTIPQKIDPSVLHNGRMPEAASEAVRKATGAEPDEQLDHLISLELGGSNDTSNLNLEKLKPDGTQPSLNLENATAKRVASGEISYIDGQKIIARAKGVSLPDDPDFASSTHPLASGYPNPAPNQTGTPAQNPSFLQKIENGAKTFVTDITHPFTEDPGTLLVTKFPALTQTLADLQTNPLGLGSSLKDIVTTPYTDVKQASDAFNTAVANFIQGLKNRAPASEDVNNGLQAATAFTGGVFTPITTWFNVANKLPVVGDVSKLLFNVPFSLLGDLSGDTGVATLNSLSTSQGGPISDQAVANLTPGVRAISILAGQLVAGKYVAPDVLDTLSKQFGATDARTILEQAHEVANEVQSNPKAPAPTDEEATTAPASEPAAPAAPTAPSRTLPSWAPAEAKALEATTDDGTPTPSAPTPKVATQESDVPPTTARSMPAGALRPVEGIGDVKTRGLSQGVEAKAVSSKLTDVFADLPQYKTMDVADQGARAIDLFEKDPEGAKQIAYGAKAPPKGLTPEAVFIAVENDAIEHGDGDTLNKLANSRLATEATTMGQRLRMLAERNPESPTEAIKAVQSAREEAAQQTNGGKNINVLRDKVADDVTKNIARESAKPKDWSAFVDSITC